MTTEERVEEEIAKVSYERDRTRPNLSTLYLFITKVFVTIAQDIRTVFRGFHPAFASIEFMKIHRTSLRLPEVLNETEISMQQRLVNAKNSLEYLGTRKALYEFLTSSFETRWSIVEFPKDAFTIGAKGHAYGTSVGTGKVMNGEGLFIYVKNLKEEEKTMIISYIESSTPPDVGVTVFNIQGE